MMTRTSFDEALNGLKRRQPFQPFVFELDDGRRFVVGQPEALMHYAGSAVYFRSDGSFDFVDPEDVRQVLELTPASPA